MPSLLKRIFHRSSDTTDKKSQFKDADPADDSSNEDEGGDDFETYCMIEFAAGSSLAVREWIISKLTSSRALGGAHLQARSALDEKGEERIIHVGAHRDRLLLAAELMELKKPYHDGTLREISLQDIDQFEGSEDLDSFLTLAEKQRITKHEIEAIRALDIDTHIPGYPSIKMYEGETILPKCMKEDIVLNMFPMHDREELKRLGTDWYKAFFSQQPIEAIQRYFGDAVAMYFAFLGFYTLALVPPALIGVLSFFVSVDDVSLRLFFCCFNLVWVTLFIEAWKRESSALAYRWGTINEDRFEECRPAYYGELQQNPITGRVEPHYPKRKRVFKFYLVTVPVIIACLLGAFFLMLVYFYFQDIVDRYYAEHQTTMASVLTFVPTVVYSVIILVVNIYYRQLAKLLNDWENHRLQSAYENHLITKLVLFDFVNCFCALYYVAFVLQDMKMLKRDLGTIMITQQVVNQLVEVVLPYTIYKFRKITIKKRHANEDDGEEKRSLTAEGVDEDTRVQAEIEATKDRYDEVNGILNDYLEMFLQFGYVFLFSAVFPTAAFWALLNNLTEIRSDAFKLCRIFQRPFAQPCSGIGAWLVAFEMMNVMAVISNTALIAVSPKGTEMMDVYGDVKFIIFLVLAEHAVLGIKALLAFLIPDEPEWVQTAIARVDFQARMAWRKQRLIEAKNKKRHRAAEQTVETLAEDSVSNQHSES